MCLNFLLKRLSTKVESCHFLLFISHTAQAPHSLAITSKVDLFALWNYSLHCARIDPTNIIAYSLRIMSYYDCIVVDGKQLFDFLVCRIDYIVRLHATEQIRGLALSFYCVPVVFAKM